MEPHSGNSIVRPERHFRSPAKPTIIYCEILVGNHPSCLGLHHWVILKLDPLSVSLSTHHTRPSFVAYIAMTDEVERHVARPRLNK